MATTATEPWGGTTLEIPANAGRPSSSRRTARADTSAPASTGVTPRANEETEEPFLPPLKNPENRREANYMLLSKAAQERKAQREAVSASQIESVQMEEMLNNDEVPLTTRITGHTTEEQLKYMTKKLMQKLSLDHDWNPLAERINLEIKDDKRFSKETNDFMRRELYKRLHELRYKVFKKLEKKEKQLNERGIFDDETNRIRIRSLFKVEVQRVENSLLEVYFEIVREMEEKYGIPHHHTTGVQSPRYKKAWRNQEFLALYKNEPGFTPSNPNSRPGSADEPMPAMNLKIPATLNRRSTQSDLIGRVRSGSGTLPREVSASTDTLRVRSSSLSTLTSPKSPKQTLSPSSNSTPRLGPPSPHSDIISSPTSQAEASNPDTLHKQRSVTFQDPPSIEIQIPNWKPEPPKPFLGPSTSTHSIELNTYEENINLLDGFRSLSARLSEDDS